MENSEEDQQSPRACNVATFVKYSGGITCRSLRLVKNLREG